MFRSMIFACLIASCLGSLQAESMVYVSGSFGTDYMYSVYNGHDTLYFHGPWGTADAYCIASSTAPNTSCAASGTGHASEQFLLPLYDSNGVQNGNALVSLEV